VSIEIVDYDHAWPEAFATLGANLRAAVGDRVLAIHHIGSTSVPGLPAKAILDVQLTVADLDGPLADALALLGFEARPFHQDHCPPGHCLPAEQLEKRYFKRLESPVNLHVRAEGRFNQRYPLLFRDYLRATPMARDAYAEIKRQLARYFPNDVDAYYEIKDPVCDIVMAGAFGWAERVGWAPGPSDA
jgi:GrpB-like predicted nucleotidyltransferase (UPF0157 family)